MFKHPMVCGKLNKKGLVMKKILFCMAVVFLAKTCLALPLPPIPDPFSGVLRGESELIRPASGSIPQQCVYVDWVVADSDLVPGSVADGDFIFSYLTTNPSETRGDIDAYNNSSFYYYYQLENDEVCNNNILNTLSIDLDPGIIMSAGYITGLDIDDDLDGGHNLTGEVENNHDGEVDPSQSKFTPVGSTPHQNWQWDLGLNFGDESTILFLTCLMPPKYSPASALSGSKSYDGLMPIPHVIPEPMSMLLLSASLLALLYRKRK